MYLPSKIKPKYLVVSFLSILLLILPFKKAAQNLFVFFTRQLVTNSRKYLSRLEELEKKGLILSLQIKELQYLKDENERLKKALGFKKEKKVNLEAVKIVSFDPSSWRRLVTINAGKTRGIKEGSSAINEEGYLLGRIVRIENSYSRLILIDDPNFSLPVFVGKSSSGLLCGSLSGAKIRYIEDGDQIQVKDKVWCKIAAYAFPVYIGEVKGIRKNKDDLFWDVDVRLFSQNPLLHKIFIVK